ncbi:MAG: hypothetical protein FJY85_25870 [Deltaproteobacteria bacterium]|nr:hypothetical protein [Deltaproteobacteria bacterium]
MNQTFAIEISELPITGGLVGGPSVLHMVADFLNKEAHLRRLNRLLQADGCIAQYRSVIDCVLVELLPKFKAACSEFYDGQGQPLANLHPAEKIRAIDQELVLMLELLVSKKWESWSDFKRDFEVEIKLEPLSNTGFFFGIRSP